MLIVFLLHMLTPTLLHPLYSQPQQDHLSAGVVCQQNYQKTGTRVSAADFLLGVEMEGDTHRGDEAARHRGDEGDNPTTATSASRHCGDEADDPTTSTTGACHRGDEGDDPRGDDPTTATTAARHRCDEGDIPTTATSASRHRGDEADGDYDATVNTTIN